MLKIGNRVDPARVWDLPAGFAQGFDQAQCSRIKNIALFRPQCDIDILIFYEGILQLFHGDQLRVLLAKKHPAIRIESQVLHTHGHEQREQDTADDDQPAKTDDQIKPVSIRAHKIAGNRH